MISCWNSADFRCSSGTPFLGNRMCPLGIVIRKQRRILREISGKRSDAPFEMLCAVAQSPPRVSSLFHAGSSALPGHAAGELLACMPTSSQLRSLISAYFMQDPARSQGTLAASVSGSSFTNLDFGEFLLEFSWFQVQFWHTVSQKSHVSIRNRGQKTAQDPA